MKTYLYRCFDRDNQLIYVGIADNVERRKSDHARDKFWWPDVVRVATMAFEDRLQALWAEWAVITTCMPVYNKAATLPPTPVAVDIGAEQPVVVIPATPSGEPTEPGAPTLRNHIIDILAAASPQALTSAEIGTRLNELGIKANRTHRQDLLKSMVGRVEIVRIVSLPNGGSYTVPR